jgi:hypothetical protein
MKDTAVKEKIMRATEGQREPRTPHEHRAVVVHELRRRDGVPYEVERRVCATCARVLDERPLKRAAA